MTLRFGAVALPNVEQNPKNKAFTCLRPHSDSDAQPTTVLEPPESPLAQQKYCMWQPTTTPTEPEPPPAPTIHYSRRAFSLNENRPKSKTSKRSPFLLPSDPKRKMSLEKNRPSAVRCRVDEKQRTDRLRESWRERAHLQEPFAANDGLGHD